MSEEKKPVGTRISGFWKGLKSEFHKISWPDKTTVGKQEIAVTIISFILGAIIALLDMGIQYGVNWLSM